MRALVVAPQPFFSPRGTPFSVYHRTKVAAELGLDIDFLTYGEGQDVDIPGVRIIRIPRFRPLEPVRIGPSFAKAFLDVFMIWWTIGLLLRRRYDLVHAHEEAVFFCMLLKPLFRFKLVYDMHSSLPQQLTNFGFTESRLLISTFEWLELRALEASDAVITISPALASYAVSHLSRPERHVLIENSIFEEVRLARPDSPAGDGEQPALPEDRPIVGYAGTFEEYQGIDLLIEAHARVLEHDPRVLLLLIGGTDAQVGAYRDLAERLGVAESCRFTGRVPQAVARSLLGPADVLVSPRTRGTNTPLKIYEQLASGIPLVATRVPSHTQVLSEEVSFLAPPEPEAFARAILRGLTDQDERRRVVEGARSLYETEYSKAAYVQKMRHLLDLLR